MDQKWTGTHIQGSGAAIVVKYKGPTNHRGSRWIASCCRGSDETYRITVPFNAGPINAAEQLLVKYGWDWTLQSVGSINADTYVITTR